MDQITKKLREACEVVSQSPMCIRTPLLVNCWNMFESSCTESVKEVWPCKLGIKLENMQKSGEFYLFFTFLFFRFEFSFQTCAKYTDSTLL